MNDLVLRLHRLFTLRGSLLGLSVVSLWMPAVALGASSSIAVVTPSGRREVTSTKRGNLERLALDDVLVDSKVSLTVDTARGSATLQQGAHEVVLHHDKNLVSVDGDLRLLSAPVLFEAGRWLIPLDGFERILPPLLDQPVQWRRAERVLVVGPVPIPRVAVSVSLTGEMARVVFEASEKVPFHVEQEQRRVTVAVARDLLDVSLPTTRSAGGILESVQFLGGPTNLFALNLGPRFQELRAGQQDAPPRLVLELHGPPLVVESPPRAPAPSRVAESPRVPAVRTIVIDPGHGGQETGAQGHAGILEKDVALAIARRLRAELVNARGLDVFLTRDRDIDVSLDERTAIANNYKADLLVSIHANASRAPGARGSEVYFLSYQASDDDARRIAQVEGSAEPRDAGGDGSDLALILWDMAQAEHLSESSALASRLQEELAVVTASEGRGVKQAPFRVLVGATMPAVLVEVAFISNPDEERQLASGSYQSALAAALARGIERYRRQREARLGASPHQGSERRQAVAGEGVAGRPKQR